MITFIDGLLEEKEPGRAVMNVAGVGYEIQIPLSSYEHLPASGARCRVLIHDHIREDAHLLFGFASETSRWRRLYGKGVAATLIDAAGARRGPGSVSRFGPGYSAGDHHRSEEHTSELQ